MDLYEMHDNHLSGEMVSDFNDELAKAEHRKVELLLVMGGVREEQLQGDEPEYAVNRLSYGSLEASHVSEVDGLPSVTSSVEFKVTTGDFELVKITRIATTKES